MNSKFSRTCVGCGKITDKGSFIRIVRNNDGRITVDETGSMNGRGAYICPSADCLEKALKRHGLERSFKMPVPKETIECISEYLREHTTWEWEGVITTDRILSLLGLAQKAGKIAGGETQVLESIRAGSAMCVIIAGDASEGSRKMYSDKCKYYGVPFMYYSDRQSLGHAVGKDLRSALAVEDEGLCQAIRKTAPELFEEEL